MNFCKFVSFGCGCDECYFYYVFVYGVVFFLEWVFVDIVGDGVIECDVVEEWCDGDCEVLGCNVVE